jgi:hypothetical protein
MKPEDIIKATRNSLNIYSFTAEALEKLIAEIQSEHKCQTCESLARTVMMDQTAHDTPPAAQQEHDAYGYAKRLAVAIWEQHYKGVAPKWKPFDDLMGVLTQIDNMTSGLTAQRQPHYDKTEMNCFVQNLYDQKMREGKRGHYETMFHVVHRAIEAAHGIKETNT